MKVKFENWGNSSIQGRRAKDISPLTREIHNRLKGLWQKCSQQYIIAALQTMVRNIDTGMTVASFRGIAEEVKILSYVMSYGGHGPRFGYGEHKPYAMKSEALGAALGKRAYEIDYGTKEKPDMRFRFSIVIFQYKLHETVANYTRSLDWNSLPAGEDAFMNYLNAHIDDLKIPQLVADWFVGR